MKDDRDATRSGRKRFATRAVHSGQRPDPATGAVSVPIYATSTYRQAGFGGEPRYEYSRVQNPTRDALEASLADLENGAYACAFGSGMAALHTLFQACPPGSHVLLGLNVYGGTYRLAEHVFRPWGLDIEYVYPVTPERIAEAARPGKTRLVLVETPSNPLLEIVPLRETARVVHDAGAVLAVDNTFAGPYLQTPLDHGADIVVHSMTKYLNGHSDSLGGVLICNDPAWHESFRFLQKSSGAVLSPFEAWLILRGVKTLPLRMERHCRNARDVAAFLVRHPRVLKVYHPDLPGHPGHAVHQAQARGGGGIVSFEVDARVDLSRFVQALEICIYGESLGGVETLICHPATMTHAGMPEDIRRRLGITDRLLRISVGIEDPADIIADLEQALAGASS